MRPSKTYEKSSDDVTMGEKPSALLVPLTTVVSKLDKHVFHAAASTR